VSWLSIRKIEHKIQKTGILKRVGSTKHGYWKIQS